MINIYDKKKLKNTIKMGIQQCVNLIVEEKDEKNGVWTKCRSNCETKRKKMDLNQ